MKILVLLRASHAEPFSPEVLPWLGPCDRAALTTALALRDEPDSLTAVTAGPRTDEACLELALRAGVPRALRLQDRTVDLRDPRTLCGLLSGGLFQIGFDLVLTGQRSADWGSGLVGPSLAHLLGVPHVSSVINVERQQDRLRVEHLREDEIISLAVRLPVLLAIAAGPDPVLAERPDPPPVGVLNLEDTTLRMPRISDTKPPEPQAISGHRPANVTSSRALLLALKNAGVVH